MNPTPSPRRVSVASLRRALVPGTKIRLTNHRRPQASRQTVVHPKTNTVDLVTWALDRQGAEVASHTAWPRASDVRGDEDPRTFHLDKRGEPFLTLTVVPDTDPAAASWPSRQRPTHPTV